MFRCSVGDFVQLGGIAHAGTAAQHSDTRVACVARADAETFEIVAHTTSEWTAPGTPIDVEVRHDDGRELFRSVVVAVDESDGAYAIRIAQPASTHHRDARHARRASGHFALRWSVLAPNLAGHDEHSGHVLDVSATGMRIATNERVVVGDRIVCNLRTTRGAFNAIGIVVGAGPRDATVRGELRISFESVPDSDRSWLVTEIGRLRSESASEVVRDQTLLLAHRSELPALRAARAYSTTERLLADR